MEPYRLCSEDGLNPAVCSCFCGLPLPTLCEGCLSKHPMDTDYAQHFHLPVYAGQYLTSSQVKSQYRVWLYKLHGAYSALKGNDEEMTRFNEQLEATRLEAQHQFEQELNTRCAAAHEQLSHLRQGFKEQLKNAFREAVAHSMEQWTPEAASLADLIWNYDGASSLMVFRGRAGKTKERLTEAFQIYMETSLPAFSRFNIDEFRPQADPESIRNELSAAKKQVEGLRHENGELTRKINDLQASCLKLKEELTTTKASELNRLAAENEALRSESAAHTKRLTERVNAQTIEIKRLSDELEQARHLSVTLSQQDGHILPQVSRNRLRQYDLLTGRTAEASLATTFTDGTVFCLRDKDTLLCAGGGDIHNSAVSTAHLLSLSTAKLTAVASMKTARAGAGIAKHGSHIYVFGGYNASYTAIAACEKFNGEWTSLPDMKCRRVAFSPCVFGEHIYLPEVWESGGVLEMFNVSREEFKTHPVPFPNWGYASVSFIVEGELIMITRNGQMVKWRVDEGAFRDSPIEFHGKYICSNVPPMRCGREVFWACFYDGNLRKFDLETQLLTVY